jgi:hypothetical protein
MTGSYYVDVQNSLYYNPTSREITYYQPKAYLFNVAYPTTTFPNASINYVRLNTITVGYYRNSNVVNMGIGTTTEGSISFFYTSIYNSVSVFRTISATITSTTLTGTAVTSVSGGNAATGDTHTMYVSDNTNSFMYRITAIWLTTATINVVIEQLI